jgi:hypothetical protein
MDKWDISKVVVEFEIWVDWDSFTGEDLWDNLWLELIDWVDGFGDNIKKC